MKNCLLGIILYLTWCIPHPLAQTLDQVNWPAGFSPKESSFYVENQIDIQAPPGKVWQELIQAEDWPSWYYGASEVQILGETPGKRLGEGSLFSWKTMGLAFTSAVLAFDPEAQLSWISKKKSIQGFHVWRIIATDTGCRVITAESQNRWLTRMEKLFQPKKLYNQHADWLQLLKERVEPKDTFATIPDPNCP